MGPHLARALLLAVPAALVGLLGLAHPVFLTPETADRWQLLHFGLLVGFPLIAVPFWVLLRGDGSVLAWAARLSAAAYAVLYTSLDAIAGVGAPEQVRAAASAGAPSPPIGDLYAIGDRLGHIGVVALAAAAVLTALVLRRPLTLVGAAVIALACIPFWTSHVFPGRGTVAMLGIALGTFLLALGARQPAQTRETVLR